jgi:hypothetical protein
MLDLMATVGINHASEIPLSIKHVIRSDPDFIREYVRAANPLTLLQRSKSGVCGASLGRPNHCP